jgi:hypothetical protein
VLDFNATDFSGTRALGYQDNTGFDFSYLAQLVRDDLFRQGDVYTASLHIVDGSSQNLVGMSWIVRLRPLAAFQINPRFRFDYRSFGVGGSQWSLRPAVRLEYRWRFLTFDAELAYDWRTAASGPAAGDDSLYSLDIGLRYDF